MSSESENIDCTPLEIREEAQNVYDTLLPEKSKEKMKEEKDQNLDLDDLLPKIGEFGRYQKLVLWLICLPACIPCSLVAFNQIFMADIPLHWCRVPELEFLSKDMRRNLAIPLQKGKNNTWDSCSRYAVNWTKILQSPIDQIVPNTSWPTEYCVNGFEYDKSEITSSIVIDFDLVCDYSIYPTIALVVLNLGSPIGVYIFGYLNDKYGRRISFFICLSTLIIGNIITAFAPNFGVWSFSRFIAGSTVPAVYQIPFILGLELVGPKYRSLVTLTTCIYYTMGLMSLSGIAYLVRDWVHLTFVTSLPFILYYIYWYFLPESPRWLLAKGQFEKAAKILERIAKVNKKPIPKGFNDVLNEEIESQRRLLNGTMKFKSSPKLLALCRTPNMRLKTALITFNWFVNITTYVGLNYYGPALGSNKYLSFFLSAVVEIPSYFFVYLTMDTWGRRWPFSVTMIISGLSSMATVLLPEDAVTSILILFLVAKAAISASLALIYPYAGEIFPTELRGIGMGTAAYVGGLGLTLIPFVTYLGNENLVIPLVIMGAMSVIGGLTSLRLPETLNQPLPQTIEEAEDFGKEWTMKDCCRCIPTSNTLRL